MCFDMGLGGKTKIAFSELHHPLFVSLSLLKFARLKSMISVHEISTCWYIKLYILLVGSLHCHAGGTQPVALRGHYDDISAGATLPNEW